MISPDVYESPGGPTPEERPSRLPWLITGLIAGASITALVLLPAGVTTPIAPDPTVPSLRGFQTAAGIAADVPGFSEGIVAVRSSEGRSVEWFTWPLAGDPYSWNLPVGTASPPVPFEFDRSGRQLATLIPAPGPPGGVLFAGDRNVIEVVATGVTSFAWHDDLATALAYTTVVDGEVAVWKTRSGLAPAALVNRIPDVTGRLVAWGDWGFAIQKDDPAMTVLVLDGQGQRQTSLQGRVLASHGRGLLLVDDGELQVFDLSAGRFVGLVDQSEGYLDSTFSPDGSLIAFRTRDGVIVRRWEDGNKSEFKVGPGFPQLSWTEDGRFVLTPGEGGIAVIDVEMNQVFNLMSREEFLAVSSLPLSFSD